MSKLSEIMKDYLTEPQLNTLKNVALASLGIGAGIPIVRELIRPESPLVLPSASGIGASIPVPEDDMKDSLPSYSRPTIKKHTGTVKGLKNYNPAEKLKEKRAAELADLTNPYYLPAAVAAVAAPLIGGNYLASKIIEHKNKRIVEDEMSKAQDDFSKALLEVNSNRLNREVGAHEPYSQALSDVKSLPRKAIGKAKKLFKRDNPNIEKAAQILLKTSSNNNFNADEFNNNLEKLAENDWKDWFKAVPEALIYTPWESLKRITDPNAPKIGIKDVAGAMAGGALNYGGSGVYTGLQGMGAIDGNSPDGGWLKNMFGSYFDDAKKLSKGYLGALGAAGLVGLGAGTYFGHRAEKRDDKDTADSYKYLGEFLRRQQEEGTPVYATPTPVAKAKKPWYAF